MTIMTDKHDNLPQGAEQFLVYPIDEIVAERFGRFAKYTILERALPDVRDGLKPVQRRILYAMYDLGLTNDKAYKKAARVVGEVIGKYHPHGDSAVYGAMCRMAQEWKLGWPLIEMHGNKGSIDGDSPAAMRYTETRLSSISQLLLHDLKKDTVHFNKNFDESEIEPVVLPAYFPNLLVNGVSGIAVGIATNIPPHNLQEVISAIILRINNPEITLSEIMRRTIKGPDFPTGGIIQGIKGIKDAYRTGKGRIAIRAKTTIINNDHNLLQIVILEIPFEIIKQDLVKKIDEIRALQKIHGIKEVRDETDRSGLRIVIDLAHDAKPQEILNYLFKNTSLQVYYNFNLVAIANRKPVQMSLINILDFYIDHQIVIITKRSQYDLQQFEKRLAIINGLIIALSQVDKVIKIIRNSADRAQAKINLISAFDFSQIQAEAIVQLRLYRLTATDIQTLILEKAEIENKVMHLQAILNDNTILRQVIIDELTIIKDKYALPRRAIIQGEIIEIMVDEKATIRQEKVMVTISSDGWIKIINHKLLLQNFDYQDFGRKPNDVIIGASVMNNFDNLLLFTNKGNYLMIPIFKLIENKWKDIGIHVNTLCKIDGDEKIIALAKINNFAQQDQRKLVVVTKQGLIKRITVQELTTTRFNKTAKYLKLKNDDRVVMVNMTTGNDWIILTTKKGLTVKYLETKVSLLSKTAAGIKALKIKPEEDEIVGMACGDSNAIYGILTDVGTIKRLFFHVIEQGSRTTKGMKILKIPKSKPINVIKTFLCPDQAVINVLTKKEKWLVIKAHEIAITRINDGFGQAVSENIIAGGNNLILDLKNNDLAMTDSTPTLELDEAINDDPTDQDILNETETEGEDQL